MRVKLRNERTGEIKDVKVGWSWTLFLFSWFLGLPLFLRKLPIWGATMFALCILFWVLSAFTSDTDSLSQIDILYYIVDAILFGLTIFFGIKDNALTGKNLLENGWKFVAEEDQATHFARLKWSLG
jgi:hypothetical protein